MLYKPAFVFSRRPWAPLRRYAAAQQGRVRGHKKSTRARPVSLKPFNDALSAFLHSFHHRQLPVMQRVLRQYREVWCGWIPTVHFRTRYQNIRALLSSKAQNSTVTTLYLRKAMVCALEYQLKCATSPVNPNSTAELALPPEALEMRIVGLRTELELWRLKIELEKWSEEASKLESRHYPSRQLYTERKKSFQARFQTWTLQRPGGDAPIHWRVLRSDL